MSIPTGLLRYNWGFFKVSPTSSLWASGGLVTAASPPPLPALLPTFPCLSGLGLADPCLVLLCDSRVCEAPSGVHCSPAPNLVPFSPKKAYPPTAQKTHTSPGTSVGQWLRLRAFHRRGCGSIPGWGLRFHLPIWLDKKHFKKRTISRRPSGWAHVSVLSLQAWFWLWGAGVSGRWFLLSGCPRSWVPPLESGVWEWRGRGAQSSCHPSPLSRRTGQCRHPGLQHPLGQMSMLALPSLSLALVSQEHQGGCQGLSEPGFCQGFFVHMLLSLA